MNYNELIKLLRHCGNTNNSCDDCPVRNEDCPYGEWEFAAEATMLEAADTIEELLKERDAAYLAGHQVSDKLPVWMPATETPPYRVGDDDYTGYLVYANGYLEIADYTTDKYDNVPYFHVDGEYEPDVTYWMPLPSIKELE